MCIRANYGTTVSIIIDCFELFIERPSSHRARALTWSTYKHHNTVKCLIGRAPQGSISFISQGYGGKASDNFVTEHCGCLNKLLPGNCVMADRGFNAADCVGSVGASVVMPSFTKGVQQLSPTEVEQSRRISNVRIHIERVIGLLRQKYTILRDIPFSKRPKWYFHIGQDCTCVVCPNQYVSFWIRQVFHCQIYIWWWFILHLN